MTQEKRRTRVAVDGMGGDRAPGAIVDGAVQAARTLDAEVTLVGPEDRMKKELSRFRPVPANLKICHASEVIEMAESAAVSVRRKPDSSICQMVELARRGEADAIVSVGNYEATITLPPMKRVIGGTKLHISEMDAAGALPITIRHIYGASSPLGNFNLAGVQY